MEISREQADRIAASYVLLEDKHERLAELFYSQLFAAAPATRALFASDMATQKAMLISMLELVVQHIRQIDKINAKLIELGERHYSYGVEDDHYPIVIASMSSAMRAVAGDKWSEQDTDDWTRALTTIAKIMRKGSAQAKQGSLQSGS